MQGLVEAKWSYVTRRVVDRAGVGLGGFVREPRLGDVVVSRVVCVAEHDSVEDVHGRRVRLYTGDLVVGAYGNRYATEFYEGYLPDGPQAHLLTAGGVVGTVASAHARRGPPTTLEVLGPLTTAGGRLVSLEDQAIPAPVPVNGTRPLTVVVVGSSMGAGKTTTAAALIKGWTRTGLSSAAGKVTGSGSGKDRWMYLDAGADTVIDFLDFGMPSTYGYPPHRLHTTMTGIRDALAAHHPDAIVLEIADGLLHTETAALAATLPGFADAVILAVRDPLAAYAGVHILTNLGVTVTAISGLITASPLATTEAHTATGITIISPTTLATGTTLDHLTPQGHPT
jgi:hypothetical protein